MKERKGIKWWGYIICLVIIVTGVLASFNIFFIFTAKSTIIGTVTENDNFASATDFSYDGNNIIFYKIDLFTYNYKTKTNPVKNFDGTKNNYELLINNLPCYVNKVSAGKIESNFLINFYNTSGIIESEEPIKITIQFFDNETQISLSISSYVKNIGFWNSYINKNGFNMKIINSERGDK